LCGGNRFRPQGGARFALSTGGHCQRIQTDLRVLFAIIGVGGVPEAAEVLGISEPTARTHLYSNALFR
jgi:hypothetical protein